MRTTKLQRRFLAQVSPKDLFPGIPSLEPFADKKKPLCETTVLPNGLRVVSQETYRSQTSLGLFVDAGSRFETKQTNGISHLLEHMAFKSTKLRTHQEIVRDVENIGIQVGAANSREYFAFTADGLRTEAQRALQIMSETVVDPLFSQQEVEEQRRIIQFETSEMAKNSQLMMTELIYEAAFGPESSLGRSLYMPAENAELLGAPDLEKFYAQHFRNPSRMVLAGAGVEHDEFVEWATRYFGGLPSCAGVEIPQPSASPYVGGEKRVVADAPLTQVSLTFSVGGWKAPLMLPMCVLHMLLGGGSSFSPGGPGKGMYSRLYTNVLNKQWWCESATAFNSINNKEGVLGVSGTCEPENAGRLVKVLAQELMSLARVKPNQEELKRARNQLKSSIVMNLDTTQVLMEDIGRQTLVFGKREDPSELCEKIDQITAQQIQDVVLEMIQTKLSFTAFGDISRVQSYAEIEKMFK